jgi:hypothetical protein
MHWVDKLKPELEVVGKAFKESRGNAERVVSTLKKAVNA